MSELWTPESKTNFAPAKATEPPKRWRNWFRARRDDVIWFSAPCRCGDVVRGHSVWPSAEVAETWALAGKDKKDRFGRLWNSNRFEYLGAFPEGERP